ncbi:MAG: hypothetical protein AAGD09_26190 [Cyanobacteria bacterium P01_F01_bin.56]
MREVLNLRRQDWHDRQEARADDYPPAFICGMAIAAPSDFSIIDDPVVWYDLGNR